MMTISGIYSITNLVDGKRYVGSSATIKRRWGLHLYSLRQGRHHSVVLQRAWIKHGEVSFKFEVIEECAREKTVLIARENYWIDFYEPAYNMRKRAESNLGGKWSDEARSIMLAGHVSRGPNAEQWKQKLREAAPRGPIPEDRRAKISAAKKGKPSPLKGTKFTDEHKTRMSASQIGSVKPWADTSAATSWFKSLSDDERRDFHARRLIAINAAHQRKREAKAVAMI
jgi:group I intron endonuclease